jgi:hypothetical protein
MHTYANGILNVANAAGEGGDSLKRLLAQLLDAQKNNATPEKVAEIVQSQPAQVREAVGCVPMSRVELATWLGVLIMLLQLVVAFRGGGNTYNTYNINTQPPAVTSPAPTSVKHEPNPPPVVHVGTVRRSHPKVGRNDACPCRSGKEYKKCCGAN